MFSLIFWILFSFSQPPISTQQAQQECMCIGTEREVVPVAPVRHSHIEQADRRRYTL